MAKRVKVTVVIPLEDRSKYLSETLLSYEKQTYKNFEVILSSTNKFQVKQKFARLIVDKSLAGDPASKRNKVIDHGKGEIIIFNDDDVFVPPGYIERIVELFSKSETYGAGGPLLTPPSDNLLKGAGGLVWESYVGSMGAGVFRSRKMKPRVVYDYPAANLIIRRDVFVELGGFESGMYPGEDTKLCLLLSEKYNTGIQYSPDLFVYHHRRSLFRPHLQQVGRYGTQRGQFALSYPQTSFTLPYFIPSVLLLYFLTLPWTAHYSRLVLIPGLLYLAVIIAEAMIFAYKKNIIIAILMVPAVITTHMYYGYRFMVSFMRKLIVKIGNSV
ncbi:hypothetical protein COW99_00420 [Candidatus Roizmanbacteria bacterium CG22_combo_CG10-13_8_21_14_all_38_20]|uniref:Glycosyltransferase 2-like domain-containing protein n=1 Tax=Candidatus Roizmanbacteria bacterium CG22_combo_CG10-13_8_21_14_all_38_20 TaxID=1974862 RepID=A0A2H0BWS4_9BACT|nr:glycosyltransferase [Candidatus Microgenomates bacterium]PIP62136.1 MAG: hypothetical protein COW99_00420 [Candidatus Roizmanbacteria bacterium CG22_combo_CG10-13_8_21_14_all_38_20]PJC31862.1 MAG: hypothetical protein CO050_02110 [Candidatus Roizmanbacteria bacterium CG_4_9_14_0_2_um_filter_38_17]